MSSAYASWDREAAVQRALAHAEASGAAGADETIVNFAFGSNINPDKMRSRNMKPLYAVRGRLPGYQLVFNHVGGYANIEPVAQLSGMDLSALPQPVPEETHGMLLHLRRTDFAELARQEYAYNTVAVMVECHPPSDDGSSPVLQPALAFKTASCALTSGTRPSSRYLKLIQDGAQAVGLDASYAKWLGAIKPSD